MILLPVFAIEKFERQHAAEAEAAEFAQQVGQRGDAVAGVDAVFVADRFARFSPPFSFHARNASRYLAIIDSSRWRDCMP